MTEERISPFRDAGLDRSAVEHVPDTPQTRAPAYRLAFADEEFLCRDELRPVRLQLELLKPQLVMDERGIESTIVLFGGARIPEPSKKENARTKTLADLSKYYDQAREFSRLMTIKSMESYGKEDVIVTGGGPGVMEAGHEQAPNEYVTPDLCFNFHYFAIRKMHFLMRAKAICVFPGGFGTLDETFEALTLIQTGRMQRVPVLLFGRQFWESIINWETLSEAGTISAEDLDLFRFVETAEEAIDALENWDGAGERRGEIPGR